MCAVRPCSLLLAALTITFAASSPSHAQPRPSGPQPTARATRVATPSPDLAALRPELTLRGFATEAVYEDDRGRARGARFRHARTGFVFDYFAIESAPQALLHVTTYPETDAGEPHTQEHLLLGKGNKGRWLGNVEHAVFAESNAFTAPHATSYLFHTAAGADSFWLLLRTNFDALLHPDYGDEEIRREVRNLGVTKKPDGSLTLDEKGTVYNEMVSTFETPNQLTWAALGQLLFGRGHPLANTAGGEPSAIRELTPARIRAFHAAHYQLGNMGMIGAFPSSLSLDTVLSRLSAMLDELASDAPPPPVMTESTLPPIRAAPLGTMRVVDYPYSSADHPGPLTLAWPTARRLSPDERQILELFLAAFAGGPGSTLYKAVVDRTSRTLELGATDVWATTVQDPGVVAYLGLEDVDAAHANQATMSAFRALVRAQLAHIGALPDGSKALADFDDKVRARIVEQRRRLEKRLDTPPQFGARATDDEWLLLVEALAKTPGFRKSLTHRRAMEAALALADPQKNRWREQIAAWGLLEVPYVVVARPSPALRTRLDRALEVRLHRELLRLERRYGTPDAKQALRQYEQEVTRATEAISQDEAKVPLAPLAVDPPMTFDDALTWRSETRDGVTRVVSTFDSMQGASVGIVLRLDSIPEASLPWLAALPALMTQVGVLRDGVPMAYDEVEDRLRREVLGVEATLYADGLTGRAELTLAASGNDPAETLAALAWAGLFLESPDWRIENLARIRDVLDKEATRLHAVPSEPEEQWVDGLAESYRRQSHPLIAHTESFLTRAHDAFTLAWRLEGGTGSAGVAGFLTTLSAAGATLDRTALAGLATALASEKRPTRVDPKIAAFVRSARALPKAAQPRVQRAGRDLGALLADLPDASLGSDWAALCAEMADGVSRDPVDTLNQLAAILPAIRHAANARLWVVGSTSSQAAIEETLRRTIGRLDATPPERVSYSSPPSVLQRARRRGASGDGSIVALVNENTAKASLVHSAPAPGYDELRTEPLIDFLAQGVFGGSGTHSLYKRIWGAALAYSGYLQLSPSTERTELYADRCVDPGELLRFVAAEVRGAPLDPGFVDYAIASSFTSRLGDSFEARARGMAADLANGRTPERVAAFRARLLALRRRQHLDAEVHARLVPAMAAIIPGLSPRRPADALYFLVGPQAKIAAYEGQLQRALGADTKVLRLWPRDFWATR